MGNLIKFLHMDKIAAFSIIAVCLAAILFSGWPLTTYSIALLFVIISCIVWLFISYSNLRSTQIALSKENQKLLSVFFFTLLTLSIITLQMREQNYTRPIIFFIIISIMVGIIYLQIIGTNTNRQFVLLEIIIISIEIIYSQLIIFPGLVGVDPWWHQQNTYALLQTSTIPLGNNYSMVPLFHLFISSFMLVTSLDYKLSMMLGVITSQVILSIILLYMIGSDIIDQKTGLLASLLLAVSNFFIQFGYTTVPNALATVFILAIMFIIFRRALLNTISFKFIAILFMLALILMHPIASMCMAVILLIGWLSHLIYGRTIAVQKTHLYGPILIMLFVILMLGWWSYASGAMEQIGEVIRWGFNVDSYNQIPAGLSIPNIVPFYERMINNLGYMIFTAFAVLGCLLMLSQKYKNHLPFIYSMIALTIFSIGTTGSLTGQVVFGSRWVYLGGILIALPAAAGVILMVSHFKRQSTLIISSTIIMLICFLMIISPSANVDNDVLSPNSTIRFSLTESELTGASAQKAFSNSKISTDLYYSTRLSTLNYSSEPFDENILTKNFDDKKGYHVLIRKEITTNPFWLYSQFYQLDYNIDELLIPQYDKVYISDSISSYY